MLCTLWGRGGLVSLITGRSQREDHHSWGFNPLLLLGFFRSKQQVSKMPVGHNQAFHSPLASSSKSVRECITGPPPPHLHHAGIGTQHHSQIPLHDRLRGLGRLWGFRLCYPCSSDWMKSNLLVADSLWVFHLQKGTDPEYLWTKLHIDLGMIKRGECDLPYSSFFIIPTRWLNPCPTASATASIFEVVTSLEAWVVASSAVSLLPRSAIAVDWRLQNYIMSILTSSKICSSFALCSARILSVWRTHKSNLAFISVYPLATLEYWSI